MNGDCRSERSRLTSWIGHSSARRSDRPAAPERGEAMAEILAVMGAPTVTETWFEPLVSEGDQEATQDKLYDECIRETSLDGPDEAQFLCVAVFPHEDHDLERICVLQNFRVEGGYGGGEIRLSETEARWLVEQIQRELTERVWERSASAQAQ